MVTFVGTQTNIADAVKSLVELDYDAVEAYETAISRLENLQFKSMLLGFCDDHKRHIRELSAVLRTNAEEPPTAPSAKKWLAQGKVILANLLGDTAILKAMLSNEIDTNTAYEKMANRDDLWDELIDIIKRGLTDERKHKKWMEENTR